MDAITGDSLDPCAELGIVSDPDKLISGIGLVKPNYRLLVPSGVNVTFKLWLAGYERWYYPGTTEKAASAVQPGEEMTVDIQVQPHNGTDDGCGILVGTEAKP